MAAQTAQQSGADAFLIARARVLADPHIQFALPPAPPPPHTPHWLIALGHWLGMVWPVLRVLTWVALGAFALFVIAMIASRFLGVRWPTRRAAAEEAEQPEWRPDAAPARALLAEADALAAAGRYGEAARLILLRSIEDIVRRRPGLVRPATTSRDLAAAPQLPPEARPAFASIARVVEASLFAKRGATAEEWRGARDAYAEFALAGHWR